ncbi:MAG: hypothetical protein ACKOMX_10250 [Actinomycetota bacterium]
MDLRIVGVTIACLLALVGGMALGWVHGSTSPTSPVAAATVQEPVDAGVQLLRKKVNKLPARLVIHLGTNGGVTPQQLDTIMAILGTDRLVVWSTIQLPDDPSRYTYETRTNETIAGLASRYDNVRILDWNALTQQNAEWIYLEGLHMTPEGCAGYARLLDGLVRAASPFGNVT